MSGTEGGLVLLILERKIVRRFIEAGAKSRSTSRSLNEIGATDSFTFKRLRHHGVIEEGEPGKWFVDELAWANLRRQRRLIVTALVLLAVAVATSIYFFGRPA
jgi:hypothetical protein